VDLSPRAGAPAPAVALAATVRRAVGLSVGPGATAVLRGIDLEIVGGQSLAIVGANGSGKTTVLRALAGLLAPLAGELTWPAGAPAHGMGVLLPQDEPVAPFSVRELVTLGLGRDGPPSPAERVRVDGALGELGLTAVAERGCREISGGEWQRARLARALVARPSLVLFDEPTNHLDPAGRAWLVGWCLAPSPVPSPVLGGGPRERGSDPGQAGAGEIPTALVLATHDLDLAARCDQVLLLASGTAIASGAPAEVLTPALLTRAFEIPFRRHFLPGDPVPLLRAEVSR
jgi:iron complex transport system ATP-binding protein